MKCIRATNVQAIPILRPILMDDPDWEKDHFLKMLYLALANNAPNVYIGMLLNDEHTECIGYIVAEAPVGARYIWIHQTWVEPKKAGSVGTSMFFERVTAWARSLGRREVRAITKRSTDALERRHGFRVISHNIAYTIDDPVQDLLLTATEGDLNGQRQPSDHQRTGGGTEEHRPSVDEVSDRSGPGADRPSAPESGELRAVELDAVPAGSDSVRVAASGESPVRGPESHDGSGSGGGSEVGSNAGADSGGPEHSASGSSGSGAELRSGSEERNVESTPGPAPATA